MFKCIGSVGTLHSMLVYSNRTQCYHYGMARLMTLGGGSNLTTAGGSYGVLQYSASV